MTGREMGPRAPLSAAQDLALIVLFAIFFAMYCGQVLEGRVISVPFAIEQAIVVGIFLARRRSRETSTRPVDWIVATGSFLPLLLRPTGGTGVPLEVIGLSVQ